MCRHVFLHLIVFFSYTLYGSFLYKISLLELFEVCETYSVFKACRASTSFFYVWSSVCVWVCLCVYLVFKIWQLNFWDFLVMVASITFMWTISFFFFLNYASYFYSTPWYISPQFEVLFWRNLWRLTVWKGSYVVVAISPLRCTIVLMHSTPFNWYKTPSSVNCYFSIWLKAVFKFRTAILEISCF